jgi:N-acetyl sugar amidotransferase
MRYCKKCVSPDTRPGIKFNEEGVCYPCLAHEKKSKIDWQARWKEMEKLCDKYRGSNGNYYDCIITASGGKDSHFQTHIFKEKMGMNPLIVSVDNVSWTETGRRNWDNLRSHFGVDAHLMSLNPHVCGKMFRKAFEKLGSPTWYFDMAIYAYPLQAAIKLNIPFIIYGENTSYERGGALTKETPSALEQINNDVVKPVPWEEWLDEDVTWKDVQPAIYPTKEEIARAKLDPTFLSYFVPWSSIRNWEFARSVGFKDLKDTGEWHREGTWQQYDQIDTIGYMTHTWMKFLKFGHWIATDYLSIYIREGKMTRQEAVKIVNEEEYKLDKKMLKDFIDFCGYSEEEFWQIAERFANKDLVEKRNGVWRLKEPCR